MKKELIIQIVIGVLALLLVVFMVVNFLGTFVVQELRLMNTVKRFLSKDNKINGLKSFQSMVT